MTHLPQIIMAAGLTCSTVAALLIWRRTWKRVAPMSWSLSNGQLFLAQNGWLVAGIPIGEAVVLWQGGFWS